MTAEFSVIIPTYRRPTQLLQAMTSVLLQSGVTVQLIVIDDSPEGSARETIEALNDSRVRYIQNPNPTGGIPSIVRNLGLPCAEGIYVHFLDDDDIVPQGHYGTVKQIFAEYPDIGMVFGRIEPFGDCPPEQLEHERRYFAAAAQKAAACQRFGRKWGFTSQMLFGEALLVCSASIFRRECALKLKGFDPDIRLLEDADFNVRVMREYGACFVDKVALNYRIGHPSLMHSPNPESAQVAAEREGHRKMHVKYLKGRGAAEFYALALFSRTLLKLAV
jgi:glycosyltransferase involved in cell wall biosynthesis